MNINDHVFRHSLGRRALLKALGLGTGALIGGNRFARAAAARPPKRIIFFYTENGTLQSVWKPRPVEGSSVATETSFRLGDLHEAPLAAHKKHLIYLENVDMISTDLDSTPFGGSHQRMQVHMLTGAPRMKPEVAGAASIDQFIAKQINSAGAKTAFNSLEYSAAGSYGDQLISWSGPGLYVRPEPDAVRAYDRIAKLVMPAAMPDTGASMRAAARQKLIQDALKMDFADLSSKLPSGDRQRIEAHASALSDLGNRVAMVRPAACSAPERARAVAAGMRDQSTKEFWDQHTDIMMRTTVAALACDLTRVVTFALGGQQPGSITGHQGDIHLGLIHGVSGEKDEAELRGMRGFDNVFKYHQWNATQFGNLISMLSAMPEGEPGETMMDHTVIYWFQPMGSGGHDPHYMPYVLAGSAGGYFRTGRYLKFERRMAKPQEKVIDGQPGDKAPTPQTRGVPHNNLLVSLCNAMDVNVTTYGNPACCDGPLAGLR